MVPLANKNKKPRPTNKPFVNFKGSNIFVTDTG